MEDGVEAGEVSVVVSKRIVEDLEVKVDVGSEWDLKVDVEGNGDVVAVMVDDTSERGNVSEVSVEESDQVVLGEFWVKEEEVEDLDKGKKNDSEEVEGTAERGNVSEVSGEVSDQEVLGEAGLIEEEVGGLDEGQKDKSKEVDGTAERGNASEVSGEVSAQEVLGKSGLIEEEVGGLDEGQKNESDEVDGTAERGNASKVLGEVSDQEVLGEAGLKEEDVEGLDEGQKDEGEKVDGTAERGNASDISGEVSDQEVLGEAGLKEEDVKGLDEGQKDESKEVDGIAERGNASEVSWEVSDQEVLGEAGLIEEEVGGLDEGQKDESEEDCITPFDVENGVSLSSDGAEESHVVDYDNDEMRMDVEEIDMADEEAERGAVVDTLEVEETVEAEYSNKLEDVHEAVNVTPIGHESHKIICSGVVDNGNANIGIPNPHAEETLVESNKSEQGMELEKESNSESSLDKNENQDSEVFELDCKEESLDKNGSQGSEDDARVNLTVLEQAGHISVIDESLSGMVTAFQETHHCEEEHKLVVKLEVSSDVNDNGKSEGYTPVEELDFSTEEQNNPANILPVESNAEFANADLPNEHNDFLASKNSIANINGNNIDSDVTSGQNEEFGAANPTSTEQEEMGSEFQTQVDKNDNETPEAEQTMSKDILLDSANQENKELAREIADMLHLSHGTECADGHSINGSGHDLVGVVEVVELDTDTGDCNAPNDNEWPELSYYTARRKISTASSTIEVHEIQGSIDRESEEIHLAYQDRKEVSNGRTVDIDYSSNKKGVGDASLSEGSLNACTDSGTSKEINNAGESATWADYNDQIDEISSSSVPRSCSHSHYASDGVVTLANLENEVPTSESGSKDGYINLNGKLEASKVEISSDEDFSLDRRPFFFLIKVPRFEDDEIREQIRIALKNIDEKTGLRDSYKLPIQTKKDIYLDLNNELEAAKLKEKAARDQLKAKRKEIDAVQAVIDKVNNAMTVEDIDRSIHAMEHKMQHETVPLSEEKQLMREIKRLRHFKEQLSSSIGTQEEIQEALDQKDQIKDQLKSLKRELNLIRSDVQRAEIVTKDAKKKRFDEYAELNQLQLEFKAADDVRQEAYMSLVSLRRELAQKNQFFWMYKDTEKLANEYALSGDKKSLHSLCVNQVERVMELWNTNDQFRDDYIKCNARSTFKRLKTFDGRSLGLNEEPPSLPNIRNHRINHSEVVSNSLSHVPPPEELRIHVPPSVAEKVINEPVMDISETKVPKKQSKSYAAVNEIPIAPSLEATSVAEEEVHKTKEEELAKKEEAIRKKEEEAKMMEQLQMEEKAKALEALERKRRMTERAQARAKLRAKKEAEQREKEKEKRLRKKEKRKDGKENVKDVTAVSESKSEVTMEGNLIDKPVAKKPYKPSHYVKGIKTTTMPISLRNRHRRKMQMWMWMGVSVLALVAMVLVWFGYLSYLAERERIRL